MMRRLFQFTVFWIGTLWLLGSVGGCMDSESELDNEPLIRVRDRVLTVLEFNKAFEVARSAYPHNFEDEPEDFRNAQLRLLNQLAVEMIILERAEDLGLSISDEEIDKAVGDIKSDYPEDTFEKTLLKTAVSYESWKARLKNRLLMQKVVDNELKDQIIIRPEDISSYYERNFKNRDSAAESESATEEMNEMIIKYLRRAKAEKAYKNWIDKLKKSYRIEINTDQWEKISGSQYRQVPESEVLDFTQSAE